MTEAAEEVILERAERIPEVGHLAKRMIITLTYDQVLKMGEDNSQLACLHGFLSVFNIYALLQISWKSHRFSFAYFVCGSLSSCPG